MGEDIWKICILNMRLIFRLYRELLNIVVVIVEKKKIKIG